VRQSPAASQRKLEQTAPLTDDLSGYQAIRVNDQYRIIFCFEGHDAHDVRCTDYH
jgi:plasmid maintenance system killer protein